MPRFLLSVILIALTWPAAHAKPDGLIIYRDPFGPAEKSGLLLNPVEKYYGARGMHILWPLKVCEEASPYFCLYSDFLSFALSAPKRDMPAGSQWRIGKYRFVVRHVGEIPYAGRKLNATVIETIIDGAPQDHATYRAVYDPRYGLVCFTSLNWKDPKTGKERPYEEEVSITCAEDIGLWPRHGN